jgi:hypothetical protein
MRLMDRVARGSAAGGQFSKRLRPEADQLLFDDSARPTAAQSAREGRSAEFVLSDTVDDRCPDAVSWSVDTVEYANGWFAVEPVHAHFEDGTSISFSAIPLDEHDAFIRDAVRDLGDDYELGPDGFHVDLWAHREGDTSERERRTPRNWAEAFGRELRELHPGLTDIRVHANGERWSPMATGVQRNGLEQAIDLGGLSSWLDDSDALSAAGGDILLHIG